MKGNEKTNSYQTCLDWIYDQKGLIESSPYGRNHQGVKDVIEDMDHKSQVIDDYHKEIDTVKRQLDSEEDKEHLDEAYQSLKDVLQKKQTCLQTMLGVTSLEEQCVRVSNEFDMRAVQLADPSIQNVQTHKGDSNIPGFISASAQDCIFAASENWEWIMKLVECIDIHLKNGAAYHQFFHEVDESAVFLQEDINRLHRTAEVFPLKGDYRDAQQLLEELKDMGIALRQWETKCDRLWHEATKVVPVKLRTEAVTEPTPCRSLVNYQTEKITIRKGEDLLLIDNSPMQQWKVRNCRGDEGLMPAVCVLIPGPTKDGLDAAIKMRLQLMASWTNALKRIGQRLICFMLLVFKPDYDTDEIDLMKNIQLRDKRELARILDFIEETLKEHWSEHDGFMNLQERVLMLRMILDQVGDDASKDENSYKALVVQITTLEKLMQLYKDLWHDWEKYKVALESSRSPELMLIVDKWEQLQFVSRDYFAKFWQNELPFDEMEKSIMNLKALTTEGASLGDETDGAIQARSRANLRVNDKGEIINEHGEVIGRAVDAFGNPIKGKDGFRINEKGEIVDENGHVIGKALDSSGNPLLESDSFRVNGYGDLVDSLRARGRGNLRVNEKGEIVNERGEVVGKAFDANGRPLKGNDKFRVNDKGEIIDENGQVIGKAKDPTGRPLLDSGAFWINEHGELVNSRGEVIGRAVDAAGNPLNIKGHFWINGKGELVNEHGEIVGRAVDGSGRPLHASGSCILNEHGQVVSDMSAPGIDQANVKELKFAMADAVGSAPRRTSTGFGMGGGGEEGIIEEDIQESVMGLDGMPHSAREAFEGGDFGMAHETKTAETEQLSQAEMEEKKTFVIRSVIDPQNNNEISLQDAIDAGIIKPDEGIFCNKGETMPIPLAMSRGLIKVEYASTKRSKEKKSSIGIVTVKTIREHVRPYAINFVKDTKTGENLSQEEAVKRGILDEHHGIFKNPKSGKEMMLHDAIEQGFVDVEYLGDAEEPEVVSKTYAVRAVVDRRLKKTITFQEATMRGIINRESGMYKDTTTGDNMYIGDAIMRGFLKARVIDNPNTLDIDPQNKMMVDKTDIIRNKLLKPLGIISAFKKAAMVNGAKK